MISTKKPFLSFLGISDSSARITPCEKPRMKDMEGDEQEDDWADQTMHWTRGVPSCSTMRRVLQIRQCIEHRGVPTCSTMRRVLMERDYSGGTNERVPESHKKRSKERGQRRGLKKRSQRRDKKNCPRNKAQDQSLEAATTAMIAVDESDVLLAALADEESDWISDSGIAYHLCRDREQDEWTKEATVAQRHAKQAQEYLMDVLEGSTVEQERKEMLWDTCRSLARHEKVQPVQDVHEEAQRKETESMHNDRRDVAGMSLFRSRSVAVISPVVHTREERWSHDDLQSDVLCSAPRWGSRAPKSYRRAGPEVVGMDNLKNSEYPPMGWRGRLLSERGRRAEQKYNPWGITESTQLVAVCRGAGLSGKFQGLDAAVAAGGSAGGGGHEALAVEGGMGMLGGAVNGLLWSHVT
ncbi:hypothetical protein Acr_16g0000170 [Actinidia rufa]|uniref:Uncharacterized protein n=1 Tax=Actinidia rufa TaxID=165716 RepID=A0A7J0FXI2_9ERIC|nr:hypothetical protein Acr_16g0000170 [Actinidia rufa]